MFKLDLSPTYLWPVKFTVIDANGRQQAHEIKIRFKRISAEESKQISTDIGASSREQKANEDEGIYLTPKDYLTFEADSLLRVVDGWEGVDLGGSTEFSRDNLMVLINAVPNLIGEIWGAFFLSAAGGQKRKN